MSTSYFTNYKDAVNFAKSNSNNNNSVRLKHKDNQFEVEVIEKSQPQKTKKEVNVFEKLYDGEILCIGCGIVIPEERAKKINATRCIKCQTEYERNYDTRPKINEGLGGTREDNKKMRGQIYGGIKSRNSGN